MKILLSTPVYAPMVGGMETMARNLAAHFTRRGHEVAIVTPIPSSEPDVEDFAIVRNPGPRTFLRLVRDCDVIFNNGANLYAAPYAVVAGKPVVMRHTAYEVSTIDGRGWFRDAPSPLRPMASVRFHLKNGELANTLRGICRLAGLRLFAMHYVKANVAISDWMKQRHPLPNQVRIHNPFPIHKFAGAINETGSYEYDFFFLGRLVSEKGALTLIQAFYRVQQSSKQAYRLCLIGDGPQRPELEAKVAEFGLQSTVHFAGTQSGEALLDYVRGGKIAVLPTNNEEPFGGVTTELLAAGKNIIVSDDGALSEIVADAGLTFPNGNHDKLAECMLRLVEDDELRQRQRAAGRARIEDFNEDHLIDQYEALLEHVVRQA